MKILAVSKTYNDTDKYRIVCQYQINCSEIKFPPTSHVHPPFPAIDSFYGISVLNYQLIARPVSHHGAVVECNENGEAKIVMKVAKNDRNVSFSHTLYDASAVPAKSLPKGWVIHSFEEISSQTNVVFLLRTPKPGNYALALCSNNERDYLSNNFSPFCHYLVISRKQTKTNEKFPDVANGLVGCIQPHFESLGLDIISVHPQTKNNWKAGILHTDMTGELIIVFKHSEPLWFLANLSSSSESHHREYVSVETTGKVTAITIRPPVHESYCLQVFATSLSQGENMLTVFVAITGLNSLIPLKKKASSLPQSLNEAWGPSWNNFIENGVKSVTFRNSTSIGKYQHSELNRSGPRRIYNGGDDFKMDFELSWPLKLKAKLQKLNDNSTNLEHFVFLEKADLNSATIRVRFPCEGFFSLVVFGTATNGFNRRPSLLFQCLINAKTHSNKTSPFPTACSIWEASAHQLLCPFVQSIPLNKKVHIKVFLAKYHNSKTGWSTVSYPEVYAFIDGGDRVTASATTGCVYEWKYVARRGEKEFQILIKTDENSSSMCVLKFEIV